MENEQPARTRFWAQFFWSSAVKIRPATGQICSAWFFAVNQIPKPVKTPSSFFSGAWVRLWVTDLSPNVLWVHVYHAQPGTAAEELQFSPCSFLPWKLSRAKEANSWQIGTWFVPPASVERLWHFNCWMDLSFKRSFIYLYPYIL